MYSTDRFEALERTLACLRKMNLYESCQKTLVVDGKIDKVPKDWEVVQVPRKNKEFCWGRMWDAGVLTANYDKIVYLDSDRLLPKNYLELVKDIGKNVFAFTSMHFLISQKISAERCCQALERRDLEDIFTDEELIGKLRYEVRHKIPNHGPGKNVMSGSVAFSRDLYLKLGGVDHWYCGHGAYADSDFHMQASIGGCEFLDFNIPELHLSHEKISINKVSLSNKELWKLGLDNFIYYCNKWKLPMTLAESLAVRCDVNRPSLYVNKKLKEFSKEY